MNDADRLSLDPVMRWFISRKAVEGQAASTGQMGCFKTEVLATEEILAALADFSGQWIDRVHERRPMKIIIIDMDSSVCPTEGKQGACLIDRPGGPAYFARRSPNNGELP